VSDVTCVVSAHSNARWWCEQKAGGFDRSLCRAVGDLCDHDIQVRSLACDHALHLGSVARKLQNEFYHKGAVLAFELTPAIGSLALQHTDDQLLLNHANAKGAEICVLVANGATTPAMAAW
jgi:hypothetical protein